jgi:hypothetical protein
MRWQDIPIDKKVLTNVNETALQIHNAAMENAYLTELGNIKDFPRLREVMDIPGNKDVYMEEWQGDLVASSGGRTYRIDLAELKADDLTGAVLNGAGRTIFAPTEDQLVMAAGGGVIRLRGKKTEELGDNPPEATHVAFVRGYLVLNNPRSQQFKYAAPGQYDDIPDLNVYSAESRPDNITALIVDEVGELIVGGHQSLEQFDTVANGDSPFQQRWDLSGGLRRDAQYTLLAASNRVWGINKDDEFVAYTSQADSSQSRAIQRSLTNIRDWRGSWAAEILVDGQSFILLQIPNAENVYGSKGITLLHDYNKGRWSTIYGWDDDKGEPAVWQGVSYKKFDGRYLVGGKGKIYELVPEGDGLNRRVLYRSGHLRARGKNDLSVERMRISLRRGDAAVGESAPIVSIRAKKNNKSWSRWIRKSLGKTGQHDMVAMFSGMGMARTWQFEIAVTDDVPVEIAGMEILTDDKLQ